MFMTASLLCCGVAIAAFLAGMSFERIEQERSAGEHLRQDAEAMRKLVAMIDSDPWRAREGLRDWARWAAQRADQLDPPPEEEIKPSSG